MCLGARATRLMKAVERSGEDLYAEGQEVRNDQIVAVDVFVPDNSLSVG